MNEFDRRQMQARETRREHRQWYWNEHDKQSYTCPDCGRGIEDVDRFEVHHIDEDPFNGDPENLIALCRGCHFARHGRERPKTLNEWKVEFRQLGAES